MWSKMLLIPFFVAVYFRTAESGGITLVTADSDAAVAAAMSNAAKELIVIYVSDNDAGNPSDSLTRDYLREQLQVDEAEVKIVQVNVDDTGSCWTTVRDYRIEAFPSLLFVKRGHLHWARVTGFNSRAIAAETCNLLSTAVEEVDSCAELEAALSGGNDQLIVVNVTDNALDERDCQVKTFLCNTDSFLRDSPLASAAANVQIVQANANTGKWSKTCSIDDNGDIPVKPSLVFVRYGRIGAQLTGFNSGAIVEEMEKLLKQ